MGLEGAAWATLAGNYLSCFVLLFMGYSGKRKDLVTLENHVPSMTEMRLFSKVRLPPRHVSRLFES